MDTGRLRLGLTMLGSWARQRHPGRPGDGFPSSEHEIRATWLQWRLGAQLALDPRFAIDAALPVRFTRLRSTASGPGGRELSLSDTIHRDQTAFGLGDVMLAGRFGMVRPDDVRGWVLDLRLGATAPTGRVRPDPFNPRNTAGVERLSLGSGTLDPLVGLESTYNAGKWGLTTWSTARIPVVSNRFGNRASRVVQGGAGAFSGFGLVRWRFMVQPEVFYASPVQWTDREAPNSDRLSLIAGAAAFFQPKPNLAVNLTVKVPYYTRSTTGEFLWPVIASVGFSYTFALIPEREHKH